MTEQHVTVPAAPVTLLDIYTRQVEMTTQLALINEKLGMLPDHETRIRALEAFRWKLTGIAVLVSVAGGYAGYLAGHMH